MKQTALGKWWKAMTFQKPPAAGDAFTYMLHELQACDILKRLYMVT
jgi:hypothetical protein